jgi:hypothetical protein
MLRKITALSAALVITGGLLVSTPASAAVKVTNGVSCTKAGATTKTSNGTYKCAKNPLVTNSKLTWLLVSCINMATSAVKNEKSSVVALAEFKVKSAEMQLQIDSATTRIAKAQAQLVDVSPSLVSAKAKLDAATSSTEKALLIEAVAKWLSVENLLKGAIARDERTIKLLKASQATAAKKPAEFAANIKEAKSTAKLLCIKGL